MGGKTKQRVAGNAKPANSGRIRELLINKHGTGNILTFSALSGSPVKSQKDEAAPTETKPEIAPQESAPQNDKPALILKKVGNRDCFVRVRVPKVQDDQSSLPGDTVSPNIPSDCVEQSLSIDEKRKSAEHLEDSPAGFIEYKIEQDNQIEHSSDEYEPEASNETNIPSEAQEESYEFDSALDQLLQIQEIVCHIKHDSIKEYSEQELMQEDKLIKILTILIVHFKEELSIEDWDLVIKSIYKWIGLISKAGRTIDCSDKKNFCTKVFKFIHQLTVIAQTLRETQDAEEKFPMIQALLADWDNFNSSIVYQELVYIYFKLITTSSLNSEDLCMVEALSKILVDIDPISIVPDDNLTEYSTVELDSDFELPRNSKYCVLDESKLQGFFALCNLLKHNQRVVLVSAHIMLNKIMSQITDQMQVSLDISDNDDLDSILILPPACLMSILTSRHSMMMALLSDYKVGDVSVTVEPGTDSYSCTLSYLFVWDLVIQFTVNSDKEVGQRIIHSLKKLGLIQSLLDSVFILLPPLGERDSLNFRIESDSQDTLTRCKQQQWTLSDFLKSPLQTTIDRPINEIELIALHVYFSVALHMPVTVRKWFNNNSNKRLCNLVNEYTVKHVSRVICSLEMDTVQVKCQERANVDKLNNLVIKARPSAKEVYAIYIRDEFRMELTIKLPVNYPLGPVQIDGGKRVGVTDLKWRSWLLQLTTFLAHQNGPILDGIDLWRRNIDKRFEGVEKCMICFSILHSNYQLPKKKCQTCSKMFHNLCLYKWFESSGNSTCPLCRNTW